MSRPAKAKLATLDQLDGRTIAARRARDTITAIEGDLGGAENLTTAMRQIIESAAVTSAMVADLGSRWLAGEQIDLALFCTLGNAQRRLFETKAQVSERSSLLSAMIQRIDTETATLRR
jgi:hypothetical protein